jgi:hypothetical protein
MCCAGLGCMIGEGRGGSFPLGGRSSGRRRVRGAGLRICADGDGLGACMKASLKKPLAVVSRMLADSGLSPGRRRVAELMLIGLSAEEIAIELRLSYHTVRGYE